MASIDEVQWNEEARAKILTDSDRVLQEAVAAAAEAHSGESWETSFAAINDAVKDRFIDYEPGPDVRKYAEMIERGEFS